MKNLDRNDKEARQIAIVCLGILILGIILSIVFKQWRG